MHSNVACATDKLISLSMCILCILILVYERFISWNRTAADKKKYLAQSGCNFFPFCSSSKNQDKNSIQIVGEIPLNTHLS